MDCCQFGIPLWSTPVSGAFGLSFRRKNSSCFVFNRAAVQIFVVLASAKGAKCPQAPLEASGDISRYWRGSLGASCRVLLVIVTGCTAMEPHYGHHVIIVRR